MSLPTAPTLDESNSRLYRPKTRTPKLAVLTWRPAHYKLTWGDQSFDTPHMVITTESGQYGCELEAFFSTHSPIADRENYYVKTAHVRAMKATQEMRLHTVLNGKVEAESIVKIGDYVVQNPGGEQYYNTAAEFARNYEPA